MREKSLGAHGLQGSQVSPSLSRGLRGRQDSMGPAEGPVGATPRVSWHLVSASWLWRLMLFPERGDKFSFVNGTVSLETAARIHELRAPE